MQRKFLIINADGLAAKEVQELLDAGFQIEKMEPINVHSTSQYSNTVYGKLAVYLIKSN